MITTEWCWVMPSPADDDLFAAVHPHGLLDFAETSGLALQVFKGWHPIQPGWASGRSVWR